MWWAFIVTVMAQEPDPVPVGQLCVTAVERHEASWTEDMLAAATRQAKRAWRKASRRSDEPLPEPEPVTSPEAVARRIDGASITVRGESIAEPQQAKTNHVGEVVFTLPPGLYVVVAAWDAGPTVHIENIQIHSERTTQQRVDLESFDESDVVTKNVGPSPLIRRADGVAVAEERL